jgi:VIT1/CCC1 family predicted Fe2+/Mn2+ transporter
MTPTLRPHWAPEKYVDNSIKTEAIAEQTSPRMESWFKVMIGAFVPMAGAFVLPSAATIPMLVITGVLLLIGFAMLVNQERKQR